MNRYALALVTALAASSALAGDAIIHLDAPGQTLYARVFTGATTSVSSALTEGTGNGVGRYVVTDATLAAAGLSGTAVYPFKIFVGTPSTSADDANVGVGALRWASTAAVDPLPNAAAGASSGLSITSALTALSTLLGTPAGASVSADIAAIEAQTDDIGVAGAGLTAITASLSPVSADLIAARVLAARGDFYPNRQQVWALQRGATGITVKNSFEITKRAGETLKVWVDFAGILGRNEFVQTINSISTSGGTVTLVASSEGITGNLVYVEMTGGANGNTAVLSITVTTTEGQVITVNATELNVVN